VPNDAVMNTKTWFTTNIIHISHTWSPKWAHSLTRHTADPQVTSPRAVPSYSGRPSLQCSVFEVPYRPEEKLWPYTCAERKLECRETRFWRSSISYDLSTENKRPQSCSLTCSSYLHLKSQSQKTQHPYCKNLPGNEVWGITDVYFKNQGTADGDTVVKVLRYKSEGRWFDSRWCHWNFSLT
jgi:hypothetical protein